MPRTLAPGDELELAITSLASGGEGVARADDGRVVFVEGAAPGDRVRASLDQVARRFARGRVAAVLAPGDARVEPRCAVFGRCGGCAWQHVSASAQAEAKRSIATDALRRIGKLTLPEEPLPFHASPDGYGYRDRARLVVSPDGVGFRAAGSHDTVTVSECPVLTPRANQRLAALAANPPRAFGEWEIAVGRGRGRTARLGDDAMPIALEAGDRQLRVSSGVFFQAHRALRSRLLERVAAFCGEGERALELYAGAGFFTVGLARAFRTVVAVESAPAAVEDLRHNFATASRVEAREQRVEDALAEGVERPDLVFLDPPRTGLAPAASRALAALQPDRIVYLSCDPATLARDLAVLVSEGYGLTAVEAFDLFPQTPHVELLARLDRSGAGGAVAR
ncbi:MAG: class I SAM-dependent RNA methyltransferase [Myxococcota bacterium]